MPCALSLLLITNYTCIDGVVQGSHSLSWYCADNMTVDSVRRSAKECPLTITVSESGACKYKLTGTFYIVLSFIITHNHSESEYGACKYNRTGTSLSMSLAVETSSSQPTATTTLVSPLQTRSRVSLLALAKLR